MPQQVRDIDQHYWRNEAFPHIELRSTYQSVRAYKAHSHAELSIGAVISGQTCVSFDGREQALVQAEDIVVIEPDRVHACNPVAGQPRSYHMLYVDRQWCLERLSCLYSTSAKRLACETTIIHNPGSYELFLELVDALEGNHIENASLKFEQLAFGVLSECVSPGAIDVEQVGVCHRLKRRLLDDLADPPKLKRLEREFGYSQETLIRLFSKQYGITPKAFINNARIERAKVLLKTGRRIVDVSAAMGFSDQSQFHRAFVAYTASTPRQYQRVNFRQ